MPELRFLSEAAFFIGCGVGGSGGLFVGWAIHQWKLAGMVAPFEGGRFKAFEKQSRIAENGPGGLPQWESAMGYGQNHLRTAGQNVLPAAHRPGTAVRLNRRQKINLCALILNSPASDSGLPREDVPLTLSALKRHGIGRKAADRIREDIVRLRLGWKDDAGTVYLSRHKAREFVARARRAGVIGGR